MWNRITSLFITALAAVAPGACDSDLAFAPETPDTWYRTVKGAWRLKTRQLAAFRALVRWREQEARRRDVPRAWVAGDDRLMVMARRDELRPGDVGDVLPRRVASRYGKALSRAHAEGVADTEPPPRIPAPLKQAASAVVKEMRRIAVEVSGELGMATELLARKRDLEALCRHYRDHGVLPESFVGWRAELLAGPFDELLRRSF